MGFRDDGLGVRAKKLGFMSQGFRLYRVEGLGFRIGAQGLGI